MRCIARCSASTVAWLALASFAPLGTAHAATCTWTGLTDTLWSTATNWSCGGVPAVPVDGDTLVFGAGGLRQSNQNNIVGLDVAQLRFTGGGQLIHFSELTGGRGVTVFGQQDLVNDLIAARLEAGPAGRE